MIIGRGSSSYSIVWSSIRILRVSWKIMRIRLFYWRRRYKDWISWLRIRIKILTSCKGRNYSCTLKSTTTKTTKSKSTKTNNSSTNSKTPTKSSKETSKTGPINSDPPMPALGNSKTPYSPPTIKKTNYQWHSSPNSINSKTLRTSTTICKMIWDSSISWNKYVRNNIIRLLCTWVISRALIVEISSMRNSCRNKGPKTSN